MIIGVFGPRDVGGVEYANYDHVASVLDEYDNIDKIITGGGKGVEQLALRYATENAIEDAIIPPNISAFGQRAAFLVRNGLIAEASDLSLLFWNGTDHFYYELMAKVVGLNKILHIRHIE